MNDRLRAVFAGDLGRAFALLVLGLLTAAWATWHHGEVAEPLTAIEAANRFAAESLARGRLGVEPPGPAAFFETRELLADPRLVSRRPIAPAAWLATGFAFGAPLLGAWLGVGAVAAAVAWTVRGFTAARWAWVAGLGTLTLISFHHPWAQTFAGGTVPAIGGALWLGALVRRARRSTALGTAASAAAGLALLVLSQPVEGLLFAAATGIALGTHGPTRPSIARAAAAGLAVALTLQASINHRITGSWTTTPHAAYEAAYSSAPRYVWQTLRIPPPIEHRHLERYDEFVAIPATRWPVPVARVWVDRLGDWLGGFPGPLAAVLAALAVVASRSRWTRLAAAGVAAAGATLFVKYPWQPVEAAPATAALALLAVTGLRWLVLRFDAAAPRRRLVWVLALLHLALLPLGREASPPTALVEAARWQRDLVRELSRRGGPHLVFVAYTDEADPRVELVYNRLPFDVQPILWARDRGGANAELVALHPDRRAWVATVHANGIALGPWAAPSEASGNSRETAQP